MERDKTLISDGPRRSQRTQKKEKDYGLVWQLPPKSSADVLMAQIDLKKKKTQQILDERGQDLQCDAYSASLL